jgi:uncharacterized RDD family membrane protein YckC
MTDRRYGGFWRRLVAYTIDKVILYFISLFLLLTAFLALGRGSISLSSIAATGDIPAGMGLIVIFYAIAMFITDMLYFIWFHGSVGQTPGKMLLGLRVIQLSGDDMTFGVAFLRWVGTLVSILFLSLGYLWIAIDGEKQGWHDKIAATLVIRTTSDSRPAVEPFPSSFPEAARTGETPPVTAPAPLVPTQESEAANPHSPSQSSSDSGVAATRNIP